MFPSIDLEKCDGCETCVDECPTEAITIVDGKAEIDHEACVECELCVEVCPNGAIAMKEEQEAG